MPMVTQLPPVQSRKLAPAPASTSHQDAVVLQGGAKCRKKINFSYAVSAGGGPQPASVARRNARERNRVKQVNNGFATLRQHIPPAVAQTVTGNSAGRGASKKLSKVDTLKLAVEYIRSLQQLLDDHDDSETGSTITATSEGNHYDSRSYYAGSPEPTATGHHTTVLMVTHTPPGSEASTSPSPSCVSSENYVYSGYTKCPPEEYRSPDAYENYEPMSPEDEELLDAIFYWQQQ